MGASCFQASPAGSFLRDWDGLPPYQVPPWRAGFGAWTGVSSLPLTADRPASTGARLRLRPADRPRRPGRVAPTLSHRHPG